MATSLLAAAATAALDCRWTANTHQHTSFFAELSAPLRTHLAPTTSLYPGTGHGFIGYPTELFLTLPARNVFDHASDCQRINDTSERLVDKLGGFEEVQSKTVELIEEVR